MGAYVIEEGCVSINGHEIKTNSSDGNWSDFIINTDKVVAFYRFDSGDGDDSGAMIITEIGQIVVSGYGAKDGNKGLGRYICDDLEDYINAPKSVTYRRDGKVYGDDDIEVIVNN